MNKETRFKRIYQKHPRVDFQKINQVYMAVVKMVKQKQDVTKKNIVSVSKEKASAVNTALKWLTKYNYLKKKGSGNLRRYIKILNKKGQAEFKYTRDQIKEITTNNFKILKKFISKKRMNDLEKMYKRDDKKFFKTISETVETVWKKERKDLELRTMTFGTTASRFEVAEWI